MDATDNGDLLTVVEGAWAKAAKPTGKPPELGTLTNVTEAWATLASGLQDSTLLLISGAETAGDERAEDMTRKFGNLSTNTEGSWSLINPGTGARFMFRRSGNAIQVRRAGNLNTSNVVTCWGWV